ncbi:MAG: type II toxin-antitoxin system VapC family toxin [Dehalococcoidia bacterium]
MILLDTHVSVWWVNGDSSLAPGVTQLIREHEGDGLGVSIISCWEIAKKVSLNRLSLDRSLDVWLSGAIGYPGVELLGLTPEIVIESTRLPGSFHRDPADQLIVATARVLGVPLLTLDQQILRYEHVTFPTISP